MVESPCTPAEQALLELRKFVRTVIVFNTRVAEKIGVSLSDMQLLHILNIYGPTTPGHLAQGTGLSTGGVTVALDRLEKLGYIRRESNPADRRSLIIHLVPERLTKLAEIYAVLDEKFYTQLDGFSEADFDAVTRFFEALQVVRSFGLTFPES